MWTHIGRGKPMVGQGVEGCVVTNHCMEYLHVFLAYIILWTSYGFCFYSNTQVLFCCPYHRKICKHEKYHGNSVAMWSSWNWTSTIEDIRSGGVHTPSLFSITLTSMVLHVDLWEFSIRIAGLSNTFCWSLMLDLLLGYAHHWEPTSNQPMHTSVVDSKYQGPRWKLSMLKSTQILQYWSIVLLWDFRCQESTIGAAFLTQTVSVGETTVKFEIWWVGCSMIFFGGWGLHHWWVHGPVSHDIMVAESLLNELARAHFELPQVRRSPICESM